MSTKDWREELLFSVKDTYNMKFEMKNFKTDDHWDHEHCSICFRKIGLQGKTDNCAFYCEQTNDWICQSCFFDFCKKFNWHF